MERTSKHFVGRTDLHLLAGCGMDKLVQTYLGCCGSRSTGSVNIANTCGTGILCISGNTVQLIMRSDDLKLGPPPPEIEGWSLGTTADSKWYYLNKQTGETLWPKKSHLRWCK